MEDRRPKHELERNSPDRVMRTEVGEGKLRYLWNWLADTKSSLNPIRLLIVSFPILEEVDILSESSTVAFQCNLVPYPSHSMPSLKQVTQSTFKG